MMISVDKKTTASFDVDAQKTFSPLCPAELPVPEGNLIVPELNANKERALIHVASRDAHSMHALWLADKDHPPLTGIEGCADLDLYWPPHAIVGTSGFDFLPGLDEKRYEYQVFKGITVDQHPYGACFHDFKEHQSTGAIEFLQVHGIRTVICGGLATDYCVKNTALQLIRAGFKVILNLAACRGLAEDTTKAALAEMEAAGVIFVNNAREIVCRE